MMSIAWKREIDFESRMDQSKYFYNGILTQNQWYNSYYGGKVIGAMSTLWVMNLAEEFQQGRALIAIERNLSANSNEVAISAMQSELIGGLLSTYALTHDDLFASKAIELALWIEKAYNSTTGLPLIFVELSNRIIETQTDENEIVWYRGPFGKRVQNDKPAEAIVNAHVSFHTLPASSKFSLTH